MSTRSHRRRIVIVGSAALCLVAADLVVRRLEPALRAYDVNIYQRTTADMQRNGAGGIVLLGSSRAKYALVPDEFTAATGRPAYNAAIPGSKVVEWQLLARRLFAKNRPRLVVLGINASEIRADYLPTTAARHLFGFGDLMEHFRRDHASIEVLGNYFRHRAGPMWALFDRRYELKMFAEEQLGRLLPKHAQLARELRERVAKPAPVDGYDHPWARGRQLRTLDDKLVADEVDAIKAGIPKFSRDADALVRLGGFLDWLRANDIRVLVVYIPNSPQTEARWREIEPVMIHSIARVCGERGVPFLGAGQEEIPRSNRDFMEEIHVGLPLARRISRRAAAQVCALGLLPVREPRMAGSDEIDLGVP